MNSNKLITISVLTLLICISKSYVVKAGGPPTISTTGGDGIKGVVKFEGTAPKAKPISMAADPSCAKQHPSPVFTQDVTTESKGDLQDVVVFVADGLGERTFDAPTQPAVVEQKGCMYVPHVVAVRAKQPLHRVNDDPTPHNIHPKPPKNREGNKAKPPRDSLDGPFPRGQTPITLDGKGNP